MPDETPKPAREGPIACRYEACKGECGLQSIHAYGSEAAALPIPHGPRVEQFIQRNRLDLRRAMFCNDPERYNDHRVAYV